jgi:diguanylate cyclase (GGDEF)-like protein
LAGDHQQKTASEPSFWRRVWSRPEPEIHSAAYSGEVLVAGIRLLAIVVLAYFPLRELIARPAGRDPRLFLAAAALGLLLAAMLYSATQRNWGRSWISFASSLIDVSVISGFLVLFLLRERPAEALSETVIFPVYLLAIGATSLRYDARICLLTGLLATVQYGAIAAVAAWRFQLGPEALAWSTQAWRLVQLAGATALAAAVVVRSRELRLLSTRDRFTGLLNRAVFSEQLEREVAVAHRQGGHFAVAMLDIDHFKRFNDTHGHAGGDEALRLVAQTLREACRATDVVARYGGEEFALILPGVMSARATDLLERFRRVVAVQPIHLPGSTKPATVTVSIGVAIYPDDGEDPTTVLQCADQRLYTAKQQGRDRVVGPPPGIARPRPAARAEQAPD